MSCSRRTTTPNCWTTTLTDPSRQRARKRKNGRESGRFSLRAIPARDARRRRWRCGRRMAKDTAVRSRRPSPGARTHFARRSSSPSRRSPGRKSLRISPDAMPRNSPWRKKFSPAGGVRSGAGQGAGAHARGAARSPVLGWRAKKIQLKSSGFFSCVLSMHRIGMRTRGWKGGRRRASVAAAAAARAKKIFAGVLTVKKTVIRFRPKQTLLPQRVSRIDITVTSKNRTSTLEPKKVDMGLLPSAKTATSFQHAPVSAFGAGVSVSAASIRRPGGIRGRSPAADFGFTGHSTP